MFPKVEQQPIKDYGLKPKQSVKIAYSQYDRIFEDKGIVYEEMNDRIYFISDTSHQNEVRHKIGLHKSSIKEVVPTRFPKVVSEKLKELFMEYKEEERLRQEIKKLENQLSQKKEDIRKKCLEVTEAKFSVSPSIKDIAEKFRTDIKDISRLYSNRNDDSITVNNIMPEGDSLRISIDVHTAKRGISGLNLHYDHMHNVDMYDWDGLAKQHSPSVDNLIKSYFRIAKKISASSSGYPGDKGYAHFERKYTLLVDINKDNYQEVVNLFKNGVLNLKNSYLR